MPYGKGAGNNRLYEVRVADNYLEKKFEDMRASDNGMTKEERARRAAWKKRMTVATRRLEEERTKVKTYCYEFSGYVFKVVIPDYLSLDESFEPYIPVSPSDKCDLLFTLRVSLVDSLASIPSGRVRSCMNNEPPFRWVMEKNGRVNYGFSYTKERLGCILIPSLEYTDNVLYIERDKACEVISFAMKNAIMTLLSCLLHID